MLWFWEKTSAGNTVTLLSGKQTLCAHSVSLTCCFRLQLQSVQFLRINVGFYPFLAILDPHLMEDAVVWRYHSLPRAALRASLAVPIPRPAPRASGAPLTPEWRRRRQRRPAPPSGRFVPLPRRPAATQRTWRARPAIPNGRRLCQSALRPAFRLFQAAGAEGNGGGALEGCRGRVVLVVTALSAVLLRASARCKATPEARAPG